MLCSGFGSICALPLSGFLVNHFGAKKVVYVSGLLMAFALLAISLLINIWLTSVMLMIFGGCTITIDVAANMNGVTVERMTGQHFMSGFHGGYSLGTLIGAGTMSVLFTLGLMPKGESKEFHAYRAMSSKLIILLQILYSTISATHSISAASS